MPTTCCYYLDGHSQEHVESMELVSYSKEQAVPDSIADKWLLKTNQQAVGDGACRGDRFRGDRGYNFRVGYRKPGETVLWCVINIFDVFLSLVSSQSRRMLNTTKIRLSKQFGEWDGGDAVLTRIPV